MLDSVRHGDGKEYIPAQGVLYFDVPGGMAPGCSTVGKVGEVSIPFAREQAAMWKARNESPTSASLGQLWKLAGVPQAAPPGAERIEPVAGWQMNGAWFWEAHKAFMGRSAIDCLRKEDGEPFANPSRPQGYNNVRGWAKTTKLERFCQPFGDQYDDRRKPADVTDGTCPYRDMILGLNRDNGWLPSDDQHMGNSTWAGRALALIYWEPAMFDLKMFATDVGYSNPGAPKGTDHQGSNYFGRRGPAWAMQTLMYGGRSLVQVSKEMAEDTAESQMIGSGQFMRLTEGSPAAQGLSPSLWVGGPGMADPLPTTMDGGYTYEHWLTLFGLAEHGHWREIAQAVEGVFESSVVKSKGYVPKGFAVAPRAGTPYRKLSQGAGGGDYLPLLGAGLMACKVLHDGGDPTKYLNYGLRIATPTQGKATSLADLYNRGCNDWLGRSQLVPILSALRRYLRK